MHWLPYCSLFGVDHRYLGPVQSFLFVFHHQKVIVTSSLNVIFFQIKDYSLWELLTFKFVNPVMDIGITRQLDFTDLLELPNELRATSCYDKLLSSWTAEYQNHHDNSSLLRAMSNSYGWTYLRLGLLKVSFSFHWGCWIEKRMLLDVSSEIHGIQKSVSFCFHLFYGK